MLLAHYHIFMSGFVRILNYTGIINAYKGPPIAVRMACLDLDNPTNLCLLCKYPDQEYLTQLHETFCGTTNVYPLMYEAFTLATV